MVSQTLRILPSLPLLLALASTGCSGKTETPAASPTDEAPQEQAAPEAPGLKAGPGVNVEAKTVTLATLNDESGPAATIGKPYALGKRILVAQVNAGGSGILPDGWKLELIEKDHGYNPQKSVQAYNQVKDQALFLATSFGTPNTLPLRPMLDRDKVLALPASLSSKMGENRYTVPGGATNLVESMGAMDFVVNSVEDKSSIKAGIVYQQDDFGMDGKNGWAKAAAHHGITIVSEQTVVPGQREFAAVVTSLKDAGATHVLLTVLPSATGPILGTAAGLQFTPVWIGNTGAWIDGFFNPQVIPSAVFANFHWVGSVPYWGEDLPGMPKFLDAYEKYGKDKGNPDFYTLISYTQAMFAAELIKRGIEAGDVSREGIMAQVAKLSNWTAGGLTRPIDTSTFPYQPGREVRVLKPDFANKAWTVTSDYAVPATMGGAPTAAAPAEAAPAEAAAEAEPTSDATEEAK